MPRASADPVDDQSEVLDWIPNKRVLRAPRHLRDFQRDWFANLRDAMFDNRELQGYLPVTSDLWKIAGAHRRDFWDANKSEVMAAFEFRRLAGYGEVMYFPALLEVIAEQRKLLRQKKSRSPGGGNVGRKVGSAFLSQSEFDFEVQNKTRAKPPKSAKLAEREEKERRDGLKRATKMGVRDYSKHPLEDWEKSA